ncbi:MAG: HAD-IB family phosphatase [Candidatus Moranbacteria bacterium]|nr:HAD-IB family phosphatase [Candidatus Moranbacteria bacterium]MDD3964720.1 HAD-IB family phosphatase [Candidatus Moranbacteria bacterium]
MTKKNKIAIFDIDGTIFRKNLHFELISELSWMGIFSVEARDKLIGIYANWLQHEGTYEDYRKALVELYSLHIKGCTQKEVFKACQALVPFHAKRTYIFAEKLMQKLRKEGYHLIAVSGSPIEVVEEYNRQYLKFDNVFGSVYALDEEGKYTGEASFEPSRNKGQVVEQYVYEHKLTFKDSFGIGDTESDGSFLRLVDNPIAFNPNQNLEKMAEKEQWRVVVEKKDVVYEVDQKCFKKLKL